MTDDILIKAILAKNKARYGKGVNDGDAFELFTAESILKKFSLSFDEIEAGVVDGKNDGGIDSVYFFVNRALIASDTDLDTFKSPVEIDLYVIQSKIDSGFSEGAMSSLQSSLPALLKLGAKPADLLKQFNSVVCDKFEIYREALKALATQFPTIHVHVIYCTLAPGDNAKVAARGGCGRPSSQGEVHR